MHQKPGHAAGPPPSNRPLLSKFLLEFCEIVATILRRRLPCHFAPFASSSSGEICTEDSSLKTLASRYYYSSHTKRNTPSPTRTDARWRLSLSPVLPRYARLERRRRQRWRRRTRWSRRATHTHAAIDAFAFLPDHLPNLTPNLRESEYLFGPVCHQQPLPVPRERLALPLKPQPLRLEPRPVHLAPVVHHQDGQAPSVGRSTRGATSSTIPVEATIT